MVKAPTTFIVGAGASSPYDLPVASRLRSQATELLPGSVPYLILRQLGFDPSELNDVREDLHNHPAESIDAFLESRQDRPRVLQIGKGLIAILLGMAIQRAQKHEAHRDEDWLRYVFERMRRGAPTWRDFANGNAGVRFVTFNFDSLIEQKMTRAVASIYRGSDIDTSRVLELVQVIHVHGQLPEVPATKFDKRYGATAFDGVPPELVEWTRTAIDQINVILEQIPPRVTEVVREAIARARVLIFLGFGYDEDNLKRLSFPAVLQSPTSPTRKIFGSAYGLLAGEQRWVQRRFAHHLELGARDQGCCEVLRAFDWLLD